jgi:hypothetical protein
MVQALRQGCNHRVAMFQVIVQQRELQQFLRVQLGHQDLLAYYILWK